MENTQISVEEYEIVESHLPEGREGSYFHSEDLFTDPDQAIGVMDHN